MVCCQRFPARMLSHLVAALSMLPYSSLASCCCAAGNIECEKASTAYYLNACLSSRGQVVRSCHLGFYAHCLLGGQNSTERDCDHPCCCGSGPHACDRIQPARACKYRKKPTGPSRQSLTGTSRGQDYPPTCRILRGTGWAPSLTSTAPRCSLLCRFLL